LPDGEPAPATGELPASATESVGSRPFGVYVHVPFCATRCGYCDFNTYTATELGGGASAATYADTAITEVDPAEWSAGSMSLPAQSFSAAVRRPCFRPTTWSGSCGTSTNDSVSPPMPR
jgi:oxygen-independent coproporphyrinogen-3 oxidase